MYSSSDLKNNMGILCTSSIYHRITKKQYLKPCDTPLVVVFKTFRSILSMVSVRQWLFWFHENAIKWKQEKFLSTLTQVRNDAQRAFEILMLR